MAGEITNIRDGIETRLKTISGLEVIDHVPDGITVAPVATINLNSLTYNETMDTGDRTYRWTITLRLSGVIPQEQWQDLDNYLAPTGAKSILAAIAGDETLGSTVDWAVISPGESIEISDREQQSDGWFYTMEFPLETYVSG